MNKTKIEWCSHTWNPVTGCLHGCPYCYARAVARRFCTNEHGKEGLLAPCDGDCRDCQRMDGLEFFAGNMRYSHGAGPFPFGFFPTFYRERLEEPEKAAGHRDVFVCSMADLFGRWVPTERIVEVLDACQRAPQHRYLFLTKNPARYLELDHLAILPHAENFWYGSTVANEDAVAMYPIPPVNINAFWSMEPLLGPVDMAAAEGLPQWVILGAETGNRPGKVTPRREWVDQIAAFCAENEIPVFYKGNLRKIYPDLPASAFPWEV